MATGKRWTVRDRYDNQIYLTDERWSISSIPSIILR